MKAEFRRIARIEFDEAASYYDQQRAGLGARFTRAVERVIEEFESNPKRFPEVLNGVREAYVLDFPYIVYYQTESTRIVIVSVFHNSRDPDVWQRRVN